MSLPRLILEEVQKGIRLHNDELTNKWMRKKNQEKLSKLMGQAKELGLNVISDCDTYARAKLAQVTWDGYPIARK